MVLLRGKDTEPTVSEQGIILETRCLGRIVRVTAIDVQTALEVVFQAPVSTPVEDIRRLAAQKLAYRLKQKR